MPRRNYDHTFWPDQVLKDAVACLAVLAVVLFFVVRGSFTAHHPASCPAHIRGRTGQRRPIRANQYSAARPEWYFLFLFQFLKYFQGNSEIIGAIVIPGVVMLLLFLMPILGSWKLGHRFNVLLLCCLLLGIGFLTYSAVRDDRYATWYPKTGELKEQIAQLEKDGKTAEADQLKGQLKKFEASQAYQKAVEDADASAERVIELAHAPRGIPVEGANTLLRTDPKTQGPELFAQLRELPHTL